MAPFHRLPVGCASSALWIGLSKCACFVPHLLAGNPFDIFGNDDAAVLSLLFDELTVAKLVCDAEAASVALFAMIS